MITQELLELVKNIQEDYRSGFNLAKFSKLRRKLAEWFISRNNKLKIDENLQYISALNINVLDLMELSNKIVSSVKNNKEAKEIASFINSAEKTMRSQINRTVKSYQPAITEIATIKANIKDKVKILIEKGSIYFFFEDAQTLEEISNYLKPLLTEWQSIDSIGMIVGQKVPLRTAIAWLEKYYINTDVTIISETEALIYLNDED